MLLEGDDDESHEDIDKEKGEDDKIHHIKDGHLHPVPRAGALILVSGVHGMFQHPYEDKTRGAGIRCRRLGSSGQVCVYSLRPTLPSRDGEEREQGPSHVVIVEIVLLPLPLLCLHLIIAAVHQKLASTSTKESISARVHFTSVSITATRHEDSEMAIGKSAYR